MDDIEPNHFVDELALRVTTLEEMVRVLKDENASLRKSIASIKQRVTYTTEPGWFDPDYESD